MFDGEFPGRSSAPPTYRLRRIFLVCLGTALAFSGIVGLFLPVVPGIPLLLAGAVVLSREFPALEQALETFEARFPGVRRRLEAFPRRCAKWSRRFLRKVRDSATASTAAKASPSPEKNFQMSTSQSKRERNSARAQADGAAFKILVFDRNVEDLSWHAAPFEARGFEVYKCASIDAALRCIEREELDFALVDQGSAAFEGLRVIGHLLRYNLHTPLIVLASEQDVACNRQARSLGARDYLQKPVSVAEMDSIVRRYIRSSQEESELRETADGHNAEAR
jgi:ActR/RegA family two-component response regulator